MDFIFEWDGEKAQDNLKKHSVSFAEATTVFGDPLALTIDDWSHSIDENRFIIIGESERQRLLVVIFDERHDSIRINSARKAEPKERQDYENNP